MRSVPKRPTNSCLLLTITYMPPAPSIRALQARKPRCVLGRRYASHEAPQYNEPTGWMFSEKVRFVTALMFFTHVNALSFKPPPPGQKRVKEAWENVWYFGMFGGMGLAAVLHYYKPDTRCVLLDYAQSSWI